MATLLSTIKRFIGESIEAKPTEGIQNASTFLETDTGDMYIIKDGMWFLKEESNTALRMEIKNLLCELLVEAKLANEKLDVIADAI